MLNLPLDHWMIAGGLTLTVLWDDGDDMSHSGPFPWELLLLLPCHLTVHSESHPASIEGWILGCQEHLSLQYSVTILIQLFKQILGTIRLSVRHRTKGNIGRPDIGGVRGWKVRLIWFCIRDPACSPYKVDSIEKHLEIRWKLSSVLHFNICGLSIKCQKNWTFGDMIILHLLCTETSKSMQWDMACYYSANLMLTLIFWCLYS